MNHGIFMKTYLPIIACLLAAAAILSIPVISSIKNNSSDADTETGTAVTNSAISAENEIPEEFLVLSGKTIVIDAGHGGADPGKVGINQALEKDINLSIALKLQELLKRYQADIIMTRTEDRALGDEQASNQKQADLTRRIEIIRDAAPSIAVSIHQNSFQEESSKGAQVFYYTASEEGAVLANILQKALIDFADPENHRAAKANDSYYLLKKSTCPLVIVECGFLSNSSEAEKLCSDNYQDTLSLAIVKGIAAYFTNTTPSSPENHDNTFMN